MSNIFQGQTMLRFKIDTGLDLSSATVKKILWQDPAYNTGSWDVTTQLVYDIQTIDITTSGPWKLQAYVEIAGKKGYGEIVTENFKAPLKNM
jgi:hypothetical protein